MHGGIVATGCVGRVAQLLKSSRDVKVRGAAAGVVANMAYNKAIEMTLVELGVVRTLVELIHSDRAENVVADENLVLAFGNLALDNAQAKAEGAEAIADIVGILGDEHVTAATSLAAASAVDHLAQENADNKEKLVEEGAIARLNDIVASRRPGLAAAKDAARKALVVLGQTVVT